MMQLLYNQFFKLTLLLLFLILSNQNTLAQNFDGQIIDKNGEPLYGSTVFIKEANQGLACNEKGNFQASLSDGVYTVEYRCLGYESIVEKIVIRKGEIVSRKISLKEKSIELAEVVVSNAEDPAYAIMRQAIKKAPYYLQIVKEFEAESYIKGNMELTKVNSFINKLTSDEGTKLSDYKDKLFLQESYNNIKYVYPDKYEQTVKAFSSSIPDNFDPKDAMKVMRASLYSPRYTGMISPLNPKAFSYYRFRYEGFTDEDGQVVNKIKIIPKLKDSELMSGYLYIADTSWDLRHAEFSTEIMGIESHYNITYNEVSDNIYLPTVYNNKAQGSIMGIGGYFNYFASIKYNSIVINDSIRDAIVIAKKKKKSLEIKRNQNYKIETDTLATKRDSVFWTQIRNIPLTDKETISYEKKDSVQNHLDSVRKKYHNSKFEWSDIISGGRIGGDSTKIQFSYGGLFGGIRDYNFVEGFGLGQKFKVSTKLNDNKSVLSLTPEVYYTTALKAMVWSTDLKLDYSPMRLGEAILSVGDVSADYNPHGATRIDNAYGSLIWGINERMLYRKRYLLAKNVVDISNGLRLNTQVEVAKRDGDMHNNIHYSLFGSKRKIKKNFYFPERFDLTAFTVGLTYTPRYYYSVYKERKYYQYAELPTFKIEYSEGFSSGMKNNSKFRKLDAFISQTINTDLFSRINYEVNGGTFLGRKSQVAFADFKHFSASGDMFSLLKQPYDSFMLLDPYEASTIDYWGQAYFNYYSKYILLKRLPFLQGKMFNEVLHLKYLYTPRKKNYMEVGYSVDLMKSISLGVHCSFDKFKYERVGIRLSLDMGIIKK